MKIRLLVEYEFNGLVNENAPDFGEMILREKVLSGFPTTLAEDAIRKTVRKPNEITVIVHMQCLTRNVEWFNFNVRVKDLSKVEEPTKELWTKIIKHPRFRKDIKKASLIELMIPVGSYSHLVDGIVDEFALLMDPQEEIRQYIAARVSAESLKEI